MLKSQLRHMIKEEIQNKVNPFKRAIAGETIIIYFKNSKGQEQDLELSNFKKSRGSSCGEETDSDLFKSITKPITQKTRKSIAKKGYTDLDAWGSVGGGNTLSRAMSKVKNYKLDDPESANQDIKPLKPGDSLPFGACYDSADEFSNLLNMIKQKGQTKTNYTGEIFEGEFESTNSKFIGSNTGPVIEIGGLSTQGHNKVGREFYIKGFGGNSRSSWHITSTFMGAQVKE